MPTRTPKRGLLDVVALSIAIGEVPPTEFRIFSVGENVTSKGTFIFDAQAARDVMAEYEAHGVDTMIDLEHLSLESIRESRNFDPDARGWCKLELRGGELWAAGVTWTPDGSIRLSDKRQRYISPAFVADPETKRITALLNIAITSLPATHNILPLVAARHTLTAGGMEPMTPEQLAAIAEALGLDAGANVEDVIATISAMVKKIQDAANGNEPAKDGPKEPVAEVPLAADAPAALVAASRVNSAARVLARLSGRSDISEAIAEVETWRTAYLAHEANVAALAVERATLEGAARRKLVGDLVKLGAETPATAWRNDDGKTPVKRLADEPIDELRDRVAKLTKLRGGTVPLTTGAPKPATVIDDADGMAVKVNGEVVQLSAREVAGCKEIGAKPEDYAANKLIRSRAQAARTA